MFLVRRLTRIVGNVIAVAFALFGILITLLICVLGDKRFHATIKAID